MQKRFFVKRQLALCTAAAVTGAFTVGLAPIAAEAAVQLEEIIVTARKREENILDIPFAISAFTEEDLRKADMRDLTGLSLFTPGMTFQNASANRADRGTPNIIIRGLNLAAPSASSDPALLFIDGAPIFGGEVGSFIDVERVEVLRGPQTAYFGRNTFSGAVNLVTKDPGNELGGFVGVNYGNFDSLDLQGAIEGPIIRDKLAFRLSARRNQRGGQYKNNFNGKREIGEQLTDSLGATVVFYPTESIKLKVRGNLTEVEDGPSVAFRFGSDTANCDANGDGNVSWRCGEAPSINIAKDQIGWANAFDPSYLDVNYEENVINPLSMFSKTSVRPVDTSEGVIIDQMGLAKRVEGASFQATIDLPGAMTLDWISAYGKIMTTIVSDENTLPRENFTPGLGDIFMVERYDENTSHEVRLVSDSEQRLRWLGGANYIENDNVNSCVAGISGGGPRAFTCRPIQEVRTGGVFGGLYYDLSEQLTLSGELRWQNDEVAIPVGGFKNDFNDVGGRLTLEYAPSEDLNYFVNYSRGFRPGGFNGIFAVLSPDEAASLTENSGATIDLDPESLDQYEIGVKGTVLDSRLQGSVVAYWGEINDQQVTQATEFVDDGGVTQLITVTNNIGVLELYGLELEGAYQATDNWLLQGSFAWNHTEFVEGACVTCANVGATADDQGHIGNQVNWTPEFTSSAVATYSTEVFGLDGFARLEWLYESTKYATEANLFETGDRDLVNLRFGISDDTYRAELYVTNLLDNDTYYNVTRQTDLDTFRSAFTAALPDRRAYGVRVFVDF